MRRLSPVWLLSSALVTIAVTMLLAAHLFFGILDDGAEQKLQLRKQMAESLAAQTTIALAATDHRVIERTFAEVLRRNADVRALVVRAADGKAVVQAGEVVAAEGPADGAEALESTLDRVVVPLFSREARWGSFEMWFRPDARGWLRRWLAQPLPIALLFMALVGAPLFALYLRRALQHLDPNAVIPERVQEAFDVMTQSLAVLDRHGRVMLANRALRALHGAPEEPLIGRPLAAVARLGAALAEEVSLHPWTQAMQTGKPVRGYRIDLPHSPEGPRQLIVNCAPITDDRGGVCGCMATLDDVTALHLTNERLRQTLVDLAVSRDEISRKNGELQKMANCDPLTGCFNRRALFERAQPLFAAAQAGGPGLSCLLLDIDRFKSINDTHGHAVGDRVIRTVGELLGDCLREGDLLCRFGGEEFCIVLPAAALEDALAVAERMRRTIEVRCGASIGEVPGLSVTASTGAAAFVRGVNSLDALIDRADQALYEAKQSGRNRVVLFEEMMERPTASAPV